MPWVGFETTVQASEQAKTVHALDRSATVTGTDWSSILNHISFDSGVHNMTFTVTEAMIPAVPFVTLGSFLTLKVFCYKSNSFLKDGGRPNLKKTTLV
jgi:hypothetical protein